MHLLLINFNETMTESPPQYYDVVTKSQQKEWKKKLGTPDDISHNNATNNNYDVINSISQSTQTGVCYINPVFSAADQTTTVGITEFIVATILTFIVYSIFKL